MATNTGAKYHQEQLHRHCRVCARVVQDREFKYSCKNNTDLLRKSGIHVVNDKSHIHPESFCETCRAKAKRFSDGKQVESSLHDYQWTELNHRVILPQSICSGDESSRGPPSCVRCVNVHPSSSP